MSLSLPSSVQNKWGGSPDPRRAPSPGWSSFRQVRMAGQGAGRRRGRPPHKTKWHYALLPTLGLLIGFCLHADTHDDIVDLFASMAAALSEINVPQFMDAFDKDMPDYDKLKSGVTALVNQAEVSSSVEPLKDEGDDTRRTVELDWYLEIRSLLPAGPIVRRREIIHCELRK